MANPQNVIGKGNRFSSTNQPKKNGRKPSAYKELLKHIEECGGAPLSKDEFNRLTLQIINMPLPALIELEKDEALPIWLKTYIRGYITDLKEGVTRTMDNSLDRMYGKATQPTDNKNEHIVRAKDLTPEEAKEYLKQLNDIY